MYTFVYVCICIHTYIYIYICMCTYTYIYIHIYIYIYVHIYRHDYPYTHTLPHVRTQGCSVDDVPYTSSMQSVLQCVEYVALCCNVSHTYSTQNAISTMCYAHIVTLQALHSFGKISHIYLYIFVIFIL